MEKNIGPIQNASKVSFVISNTVTVNSEIFCENFFSGKVLKVIFATLKIRDLGMI